MNLVFNDETYKTKNDEKEQELKNKVAKFAEQTIKEFG